MIQWKQARATTRSHRNESPNLPATTVNKPVVQPHNLPEILTVHPMSEPSPPPPPLHCLTCPHVWSKQLRKECLPGPPGRFPNYASLSDSGCCTLRNATVARMRERAPTRRGPFEGTFTNQTLEALSPKLRNVAALHHLSKPQERSPQSSSESSKVPSATSSPEAEAVAKAGDTCSWHVC